MRQKIPHGELPGHPWIPEPEAGKEIDDPVVPREHPLVHEHGQGGRREGLRRGGDGEEGVFGEGIVPAHLLHPVPSGQDHRVPPDHGQGQPRRVPFLQHPGHEGVHPRQGILLCLEPGIDRSREGPGKEEDRKEKERETWEGEGTRPISGESPGRDRRRTCHGGLRKDPGRSPGKGSADGGVHRFLRNGSGTEVGRRCLKRRHPLIERPNSNIILGSIVRCTLRG